MLTKALVTDVMGSSLQGQPAPIAVTLNWIAMVAAAHLAAFNAAIACVQIALGLALITSYHSRAALVASIPWAVLVWVGGEGLGMLLTGQASALTGAPGAVLLYALIALGCWPATGSHRTATSVVQATLVHLYVAAWASLAFSVIVLARWRGATGH